MEVLRLRRNASVCKYETVFLASKELASARKSANLSMRRLAKITNRPVSTVARIELGTTDPSVGLLDELLRACGRQLTITALSIAPPETPSSSEGTTPMPTQPSKYPNPRGDDAWDNDAIHFLLEQPDVSATFKRGPLAECLRRQPNRLDKQPHRVAEAADLAARHGVRQIEIYDARIGKTVVRLVRTDPSAPAYPADRMRTT